MLTKRLAILTALTIILAAGQILAGSAAPAPYLEYQQPDPPQTSSYLETGSYILSLAATFLLVLGLAYLTSKLVASKMKLSGGKDGKIISCLAFGAGRGVYLVEFAGRYLLLGVTEHSINLLRELSDEAEIERLKNTSDNSQAPFDLVFRRQISSLQQISHKFPTIFGGSDESNPHPKKQPAQNRHADENREKR